MGISDVVAQLLAPQAAAAPEPISANNIARAAATGVPILGGLLNRADAATNAALAPVLNRFYPPAEQLSEPTFGERYNHALADQNATDAGFAAAHPVVNAAAQLGGSTAALGPVLALAPETFGMTGTVPQMMRNGALANGALSGADAVTRGNNPIEAAGIGAGIGGAGGPIGKVVSAITTSKAQNAVNLALDTAEDIASSYNRQKPPK